MLHLLVLMLLATAAAAQGPRELVIFHTNDIHGHFLPEPARWRPDSALVGGFEALHAHLDSLRAVYPRSLYLDAGDVMTGNPICNIEYDGLRGGALQALLARCGLDAGCLGNHEFDLGANQLRAWVKHAPYPLLSANLQERAGGTAVAAAHRIFEVKGLRVGVIGLLLDDLAGVVARTCLEPFLVADAARAAQAEIRKLDSDTELIILLTHMGVEADSVLATKVRGADIIVGGHSHTRLEQAKRVNGVLIVQAGAHLKQLGMLTVAVSGDSVAAYQSCLLELVAPARPSRRANHVTALADSLEVVIQARYGQVIGELAEPWVRSYHTGSNVGNWICDRLRERYRADVALVNAGGIRTNLDPGPVTMLDVLELLPFTNAVVTFETTGAELMNTAREQAKAQGLKAHGALEMSGLTVRYAKRGDRIASVEAAVSGQPLDSARTYRVVSIDYVAVSQWAEYLAFEPRRLELGSELISDVITDEIRKSAGPIHGDDQPRLIEVSE